ncbi:MAG: type II CRISPR RNA-guided endonuclease Cas9 [Sphingomonadales bacterium]|nr:type II CRISPR RNA-guided endonuclease Cas9 [Sphingomonadales bacterium]
MDKLTQLHPNYVMGMDVGTSSVGWGFLDIKNKHILQIDQRAHQPLSSSLDTMSKDFTAAGVWLFDPIESKESNKWVSKSRNRGEYKRTRRTLRRQKKRLQQIRQLFYQANIIPTDDHEILFHNGKRKAEAIFHLPVNICPYELRRDALIRKLNGYELFRALYHIAVHRGYEPNSKSGDNSDLRLNDPEKKPKKRKKEDSHARENNFESAIARMDALLSGDRMTVGEAMLEGIRNDKLGVNQKRNRDHQYIAIIRRRHLIKEVKRIFDEQRNFGSLIATEKLQEEFGKLAWNVAQGQNGEEKVGACPFLSDSDGNTIKRAPKFSPTYEKYRFLQKLTNIRFLNREKLTSAEIEKIMEAFGYAESYSWLDLRKVLQLPTEIKFKNSPKDENKDIVAARGSAARGTYTLWQLLPNRKPDDPIYDDIARKLSFFGDIRSIISELQKLGLSPEEMTTIEQSARKGDLRFFRGAGGISLIAARMLSEKMLEGKDYVQACKEHGWNHEMPMQLPFEQLNNSHELRCEGIQKTRKKIIEIINHPKYPAVTSPGARKAVTEAIKQFAAIVHGLGFLPSRLHIELSRDIGQSIEKKNEEMLRIAKATARNKKLAEKYEKDCGRKPRDGTDDLLRYRLWREQQGWCPYTKGLTGGGYINLDDLANDFEGLRYQIDHILPWSWSKDDSLNNLVLCYAERNQEKAARVPWEYFMDKAPNQWERFKAHVELLPSLSKGKESDPLDGMGGYKKRNLLVEGETKLQELKERIPKSHENDTRYATKVLLQALECFYPIETYVNKNGKVCRVQHVFARPGPLIAKLRHAWGLDHLKYGADGKRNSNSQHHAIDALIVAAVTNGQLNELTIECQKIEKSGGRGKRGLGKVYQPWPEFSKQVQEAYQNIFVARSERRRARGKGHDATINQIANKDGKKLIYKRTPIKDLGMDKNKFNVDKALKQLDEIKEKERSTAIYEAIKKWIIDGRPQDKLPKSPKGDVIRKVRLLTNKKLDVPVRGGAADRGEMVRVDIFAKPNKRGKDEFYAVPIYRHEVADRANNPTPPNIAIPSGKPIDSSYRFCFSVYSFSYLEIIRSTGEVIEGYYRGFDRDGGKIAISLHNMPDQLIRSIGIKKLSTIRKFTVDRFGNRFEVKQETRTWHGAACTSPNPPD